MRALTRRTLLAGLLLASTAALAEGPVAVQADVVFASTKPGPVDPTLVKMQETLAARTRYLTLEKRSTERLSVSQAGVKVALPNGKTALVSLEALKEGIATLRVKLPPTDATYSLAKDKSFYLQGGAHEGGELWLVLSQPK
ncbi:MAG: hypothetical protein INH41_11910 [Myxococcaceae bacterium]|jgi:hypothetical protein|nr:hypothetical protein [Myxococcaceae bacterium]